MDARRVQSPAGVATAERRCCLGRNPLKHVQAQLHRVSVELSLAVCACAPLSVTVSISVCMHLCTDALVVRYLARSPVPPRMLDSSSVQASPRLLAPGSKATQHQPTESRQLVTRLDLGKPLSQAHAQSRTPLERRRAHFRAPPRQPVWASFPSPPMVTFASPSSGVLRRRCGRVSLSLSHRRPPACLEGSDPPTPREHVHNKLKKG